MPSSDNSNFLYKIITTSTAFKAGQQGCLGKLFVSAVGTTPTIAVFEGQDTTGVPVVPAFTPTAPNSYDLPAQFNLGNGFFVQIGGTGTTSVTVFYN